MAKCLEHAVLWLLLGIQLGFLLAYLIYYRDDSIWINVVALPIIGVADVAAVFAGCIFYSILAAELQSDRYYHYVWFLYVVLLIPTIVIIYELVEDADMNDRFLNPEVLKAVLCITPFLLLLLVNTADHSEYHKEAISKMSVTMTIHLFDAIDMMDIVLNGKEHGSGNIPKVFGRAMIALACVNLFLSAWQLAENKSSNGNVSTKIRLVVVILVNLAFLSIRAVVVSHYQGTNETIFIAKNIITIITSISQISRGCTGRRKAARLLDNEHDSDE